MFNAQFSGHKKFTPYDLYFQFASINMRQVNIEKSHQGDGAESGIVEKYFVILERNVQQVQVVWYSLPIK